MHGTLRLDSKHVISIVVIDQPDALRLGRVATRPVLAFPPPFSWAQAARVIPTMYSEAINDLRDEMPPISLGPCDQKKRVLMHKGTVRLIMTDTMDIKWPRMKM